MGLALESAALTESTLRTQSEARLSALVQHSPDVILVTRYWRAVDKQAVPSELREKILEGALRVVGSDLGESCLGPLSTFTRLGAFQVVIAEEGFHYAFAIRDLAALAGS